MEVFAVVFEQFLRFLHIRKVYEIVQADNYEVLATFEGVSAFIVPILPILLIVEFFTGIWRKSPNLKVYKITFLTYVSNVAIRRFLTIMTVAVMIGLLHEHALFQLPFTWYGFIIGYVIWELGHFIYHYLGHKVRLFWCLHSTHHAPEAMNLSVNYAHFLLERPYAIIIRSTTCLLLGVPPAMLAIIMFIDWQYGYFIHIGENVLKDARFGVLQKFILTPSHHRVHHARNPLYMDRNYCNLLNIWDRIFGTYQEEVEGIKIEYGITRPIKPGSFLDAYFGEFVSLFRDMAAAPGLKNKLLYMVMAPGWSHTGHHQTAEQARRAYLASLQDPDSPTLKTA